MWSEQSKKKILTLFHSPAPWLEIGQAFLWIMYGLAILASGGTWIQIELYQGEAATGYIVVLGSVLLIIGCIHARGIYKQDLFIRSLMAQVSTVFWSALIVLYLHSPTHKIGSVSCLAFMLGQVKTYLWTREIARRERVVRTSLYRGHRIQHAWGGGDHSVDDYSMVLTQRRGIDRAGEITAGGARTTTRLLHSAP